MWKSFCDNKEETHSNFKLAFKRIFDYVKSKADTGKMSWQELETFIWVVPPYGNGPMNFYTMRDMAADAGWVVDGEWVGDKAA